MTHRPARPNPVPWWQRATGYQIWPRSFCDSNGDGIGDIPGIIGKLDHLGDLGIGFIWLSPVYASPMVDMGYDISDYRAIAPEFGTLDDFDRLIAEAGARNIRIVMDLVVNHTSDRHAWFGTARADPAAPEHAFYIWRDPAPDGGPPSDLRACFGGPAWHWVPDLGKYYLGYFSSAQPDLNWRNPALRREVFDMMNWWLDRGIGGFRMDVISLIGKDVDAGIYEEGPYLHEYLREMHRETLAGRDVVTIGESWSVSPDTALLYCGRDRRELDMVFQFNHVTAFEHPVHGKWQPRPFDLVRFKAELFAWQAVMADDGWNSLFLSNHDLPRQVSKYGDPVHHRVRSAKMLATAIHLMRGTPFIYQGEEIGMTNAAFSRIGQFRDLETLGLYRDLVEHGMSERDFIAGANRNGRDNARTPVQWSDVPHAAFTTGTPWIEVNPNADTLNVAADRADPNGVFAHYARLIHLRRTMEIVSHGRFVPCAQDDPAILAYARECEGRRLSVVANFTGNEVAFDVPERLAVAGAPLVHNVAPRTSLRGRLHLAPYEAFAVLGAVEP
ncbi:MAG: alpha-glucosidase [Rhodobacteraceae bacterium]|nr:alpha-glucosidase [Paracoccaceae bacterium]